MGGKSGLLALIALLGVAGCDPAPGGPYAPGVARGTPAGQMQAGHRLMDAGEYELALRAFTRAALDQGLTGETLGALGTANLGLGRLGQAEDLLRQATEAAPEDAATWNNLGVVLMERGKFPEAAQIFRRAFALSDGSSDVIRENLAKALAKRDGPVYDDRQEYRPQLIRRGTGDVLLKTGL